MSTRIISYNIFEGASGGLKQLEQFISIEEPDVLCLQEANGWAEGSPSTLEQFAAATGMDVVMYGGNRRFTLAILARCAAEPVAFHGEGFWHGALEALIQTPDGPLTVINTHADPISEDGRAGETTLLRRRIAILPRPVLLTGDMNSLARVDGYDPGLAVALTARGVTKFGTEANRYEADAILTDAGLVDLGHKYGNLDHTVPTAANTDPHHAAKLRLDRAYGTPDVAARLQDFSVHKGPLTDAISDHYPISITLNG